MPSLLIKDQTKRNGAFTLVELLVVISIIALLVSILMPALAKARNQAKNVMCMSNLHQVGLSCQMYTMDFEDVLPIAWDQDKYLVDSVKGRWMTTLDDLDYLPDGKREAILCPSFAPTAETWHELFKKHGVVSRSYGMRYSGTGFSDMKISKIKTPSQFLYVADSIEMTTTHEQWYYIEYPGNSGNYRIHTGRHNKKANALMADNSVARLGKDDILNLYDPWKLSGIMVREWNGIAFWDEEHWRIGWDQ